MTIQKSPFSFFKYGVGCLVLVLTTVLTLGCVAENLLEANGEKHTPVPYQYALAGSCNFKPAKTPVSLRDIADNSEGAKGPAPVISVQAGHAVSCMAASPDGNYLVSVSGDIMGQLTLWEMESGREIWTVQPCKGSGVIQDVSFSSDGRYIYTLVTTGGDIDITIWDPLTGNKVGVVPKILNLNYRGLVTQSSFFTDNGSHVILWYSDRYGKNTTGLFELPTGRKIREFDGEAMSLSPGGKYVLTKSIEFDRDYNLGQDVFYLWNACNGKLVKKLPKYFKDLRTPKDKKVHWYPSSIDLNAAISPDGRFLAVGIVNKGPMDEFIRILTMYDLKSGKLLWHMPFGEGPYDAGSRLIFSGSSRLLYYYTRFSPKLKGPLPHPHVYALNPENGQIVKELDSGTRARIVGGLALSQDGNLLASLGKNIVLVDSETFQVEKTLKGFALQSPAALTHQGTIVTPYHVWDPATGQTVRKTGIAPGKDFLHIAVSPDGNSLILLESGEDGKNLQVVKHGLSANPKTKTIPAISKEGKQESSPFLSPDGRFLGFGGSSGPLCVLDTGSGRKVLETSPEVWENYHIGQRRFSLDGNYLAANLFAKNAAGNPRIVVWKLPSGKKILERHMAELSGIVHIAFDHKGAWMLEVGSNLEGQYPNEHHQLIVLKMDPRTGDILREIRWEQTDFDAYGSSFVSVVVSGDDTMAAVQQLGGSIILLDISTGDFIKKIPGSKDQVGQLLAFSPDNTRLYINTWGGAGIVIKDIKSGRELARLFELENGEWLSMTPEGYYASSEKADQYLNVRVGMQVSSLDQYYEVFYRPDLVAANLKVDATAQIAANEPKKDILEVAASGSPPQVLFHFADGQTTVTQRDVEVAVELMDTGGGVGKVEWKINGVTVGIMEDAGRGIAVVGAGKTKKAGVTVKKLLTLSPGQNVIQVTAANAANEINSVPAVLKLMCRDQISESPSLYLLMVGINKYRDGSLRLTYSVPDAQAVSQIFDTRARSIFDKIVVEQVFDENATMEGIQAAFEKINRRIKTNDVFVFYVAGHGVAQEGRYYLLPYDFRFRNASSVRQKGITQDHLQKWLASIQARKSLILMDTCNSGAFTKAKAVLRGIAEKSAINRLTRATGRAIIVAAKDDQPALEGYKGHGVFTYVLLNAFKEADKALGNRDRQTSIFELAAYIDEHVPEITFRQFGYEQVPQVNMQGRDFPIATVP